MTDYDAMTDEQLAALVAERVMGWRSFLVARTTYGGQVREKRWYPADTPDLPPCGYWSPARPDMYPRPTASNEWSPTTSWADAGRVTEKMRADGWDCLVTIDGHMEGRSQRAIVHVSRAGSGGFGHADSPCRAICIAALRAVDA